MSDKPQTSSSGNASPPPPIPQRLKEHTDSELIIALIAPVATQLEPIRQMLAVLLAGKEGEGGVGYTVQEVRITKDVIEKFGTVPAHDSSSHYQRIKALMDAGDGLRKDTKNKGVLAYGAAMAAASLREHGGDGKPGLVQKKRRAVIISALKHPDEVHALRTIYGQGFYLIAVHEDADTRQHHMVHTLEMTVPQAKELMKRDEEDPDDKRGQQMRDAFHLADFFIRIESQKDMEKVRSALERVVNLIFGDPFQTPTFEEYAMFMAFAASLRSADLSRQVGAVVTRDRQVVSTGANDCPQFGGGLYWPVYNEETGKVEDFPNGRDFMVGRDSNAVARKDIMDKIVDAAMKNGLPDGKKEDFEKAVRASRIRDLTEFGRVVHAEMEALLSCGRLGVSTVGAELFGTTFPCHNCAKHIIAAGIKRVVFIEPYPKSKAVDFHKEAIRIVGSFQPNTLPPPKDKEPRVLFEPFVGVGPRRFFDLFSSRLGSGYELSRKDNLTGERTHFSPKDAKLRLQMLPHSYLDTEADAADWFRKAVKHGKGTA